MKPATYLFILLALLVGSFAAPGVAGSAFAQQSQEGDTVGVIIQTSGSSETLAGYVESLGGTVNVAYDNVPAVAASIPASKMGELLTYPGVTHIEKDRLVSLQDDIPLEKETSHPMAYAVEDVAGVEVKAVDPTRFKPDTTPAGYANFGYTGADKIWEDTGYGEGTVVAVVDSGTVRNPCLQHAVIGAPGFPDGYNATGDGISPVDPRNYWHGTVVGGAIASSCVLDLSGNPSDPLYQAISRYLPWPADSVPIYGQAPKAQLYPVKVFDVTGRPTPTSLVLEGLDHILTLKKGGLLDIDIVNLGLGGSTVYDGRDAFDRFLKELYKAGILVVAAAGNNGPVPNSVGSPATSFSSVAVGALDYAPSSRVLYEYLGLVFGPDQVENTGDEGPGMGMVMRPTREVRVVNFSSRGPLSDGRMGPDLVALGHWNFHLGPQNNLLWASGTSFSSATVAGAAALLNAFWESHQGRETSPSVLRNVLLLSADPRRVNFRWKDPNDQGFGALDVARAFDRLKEDDVSLSEYPVYTGRLDPNILGKPVQGSTESYRSGTVNLRPSQERNAIFSISRSTSKVTVEIYDIVAPDNSDRAYLPNALEIHIQSAIRSDVDHPVAIYWYPALYGDSVTIEIEDGRWSLAGLPWAYQPMQPGLMKVSLIGDYANETRVRFKMRITRENYRVPPHNPIFEADLEMGDAFVIPVEIPAGTSTATFDLTWKRTWNNYPTSDIDLLVFDPDFNLVSLDGATLNAPERAVVADPVAGTWQVFVLGSEMYRPDHFKLFVKTE